MISFPTHSVNGEGNASEAEKLKIEEAEKDVEEEKQMEKEVG